MRGRRAYILPVLGLLVVSQWGGRALTWFLLRHQLLNWALLTLSAGPLLIVTRFEPSPVEIKEQLAHHAPYLLFSLLCTCTLSLCGCAVFLRNLRQVSAASHNQVRRPGKLGTIWRALQNLAQSQKAVVQSCFIKSGQLTYRDTQIT